MTLSIPAIQRGLVTTWLSSGRSVIFAITPEGQVLTSEKTDSSYSKWKKWKDFGPLSNTKVRDFAACIQLSRRVRVWYVDIKTGAVFTSEQDYDATDPDHASYGKFADVSLKKKQAVGIDSMQLHDGRVQVFCADTDGIPWTRWQEGPNHEWTT
jgi:hypothetical protein